MKNFALVSALFLFLISCSDKKENEKSFDLSTDEGVINELNKNAKNKFSKENICIKRPGKFKDLILLGYTAKDRTCSGNEVFYKSKKSTVAAITQTVLKDNGWNERQKRETLAIQWVSEVLLKWSTTLFTEPEEFAKNGSYVFMPPSAKNDNGEIVVSVWALEPAGFIPQSSYYLFTAVFSPEGELLKSQVTDRFSVSYEF